MRPCITNRKWLEDRLIKEKRTYQEVANSVGYSKQRIHQLVKEMGLLEKLQRKRRQFPFQYS